MDRRRGGGDDFRGGRGRGGDRGGDGNKDNRGANTYKKNQRGYENFSSQRGMSSSGSGDGFSQPKHVQRAPKEQDDKEVKQIVKSVNAFSMLDVDDM